MRPLVTMQGAIDMDWHVMSGDAALVGSPTGKGRMKKKNEGSKKKNHVCASTSDQVFIILGECDVREGCLFVTVWQMCLLDNDIPILPPHLFLYLSMVLLLLLLMCLYLYLVMSFRPFRYGDSPA